MWRLVRAAYDVSNLKKTSANDQRDLIYYAMDVIKVALSKNDKHPAVHNWYGVILSRIGDFEGTKVQIANSQTIKDHWLKAIELDPIRPATYHLLGRCTFCIVSLLESDGGLTWVSTSWILGCMRVADLSWIERKAAAVLFGSPPESSYDESLTYLHKCDELQPNYWKKNALLIAEVYYKKRDWANSKKWTEKALAIPSKTEEEETVHEEAQAFLKKF
jgi:hypothetical protein